MKNILSSLRTQFLATLFLGPLTHAAESSYCSKLNEHFDSEIKQQIVKGIPFDVVFLLKDGPSRGCKTIINVRYDLWQEKVRLSKNGATGKGESLDRAGKHLCELSLCEAVKEATPPRPVRMRVLLNPLWEGTSKDMIGTKQNSKVHFFRLDWNELSQELPKDVEIINEEVLL
jgi:hypothetical protein